jgi:hypothetical protein
MLWSNIFHRHTYLYLPHFFPINALIYSHLPFPVEVKDEIGSVNADWLRGSVLSVKCRIKREEQNTFSFRKTKTCINAVSQPFKRSRIWWSIAIILKSSFLKPNAEITALLKANYLALLESSFIFLGMP